MGRPKGSKNKRTTQKPVKMKSQFANTEMANKLHKDFQTGGGLNGYDGLRQKYEKIFESEYFCMISFTLAWKRLLKKVHEVHGVDYLTRYNDMMEKRKFRGRPHDEEGIRRRRQQRIEYHKIHGLDF